MSDTPVDREIFEARLILDALRAGKPPGSRVGQRFFFGRDAELELFQQDLATVAAGLSSFRIIVGEHGAGKSALLDEMLHRARRARFVTIHVELSRDCLLTGNDGEARNLLEQALLAMRTLASGKRSALDALIGSFRDVATQVPDKVGRHGVPALEQLGPLTDLPRGFDFARVIAMHGEALARSDDELGSKTRRWLLANAAGSGRRDVGAAAIRDSDQWSFIKLWAKLARLAGRPGLIVVLDELRSLPDLMPAPRAANFAQLFKMFSDIHRGEVEGLGLFLAATPSVLSREYNAICSEAGLDSCLHGGKTIGAPTDVVASTAVQVPELDFDSLVALLSAVRDLLGKAKVDARLMPASDILDFIEQSRDELGGSGFPLPRDLIRQFLDLHNRLAVNPSLQWRDVLRGYERVGAAVSVANVQDGFAERLV